MNCLAANLTDTLKPPAGTFTLQPNGTYTFTVKWAVTYDCGAGNENGQCVVCTKIIVIDLGNNAKVGEVFVSGLPGECNKVGNVANITTNVAGLTLNHNYQFDFYYSPLNPALTCQTQGLGASTFTEKLVAK